MADDCSHSGDGCCEGLSLAVIGVSLPTRARAALFKGLALAANAASVLMLMRYKNGDANVRSVWLCSRNDAIGAVVVMIAAAGVWGTGTAWPDLGVAALTAGIFATSSAQILRQAWAEFHDGCRVQPLAAG